MIKMYQNAMVQHQYISMIFHGYMYRMGFRSHSCHSPFQGSDLPWSVLAGQPHGHIQGWSIHREPINPLYHVTIYIYIIIHIYIIMYIYIYIYMHACIHTYIHTYIYIIIHIYIYIIMYINIYTFKYIHICIYIYISSYIYIYHNVYIYIS